MIVRNLLISVGLLAIFFPINCQGILYSNYKILYNARRSLPNSYYKAYSCYFTL